MSPKKGIVRAQASGYTESQPWPEWSDLQQRAPSSEPILQLNNVDNSTGLLRAFSEVTPGTHRPPETADSIINDGDNSVFICSPPQ